MVVASLKKLVKNRFQTLEGRKEDIELLLSSTGKKDIYTSTAEEIVGYRNLQRKEWMTEET